MEPILAFFGLSCGGAVALTLLLMVLFGLGIHVGTLAAGLDSSLGRAMGVLPLLVVLAIPVGLVYGMVESSLPEVTQAIVSTLASAGLGTLAIHWLYQAEPLRALLAYLVGSSTFLGALIAVVLVFF